MVVDRWPGRSTTPWGLCRSPTCSTPRTSATGEALLRGPRSTPSTGAPFGHPGRVHGEAVRAAVAAVTVLLPVLMTAPGWAHYYPEREAKLSRLPGGRPVDATVCRRPDPAGPRRSPPVFDTPRGTCTGDPVRSAGAGGRGFGGRLGDRTPNLGVCRSQLSPNLHGRQPASFRVQPVL